MQCEATGPQGQRCTCEKGHTRPHEWPPLHPERRVAELIAACREWRDFMFRQMPREEALARAVNPGTAKIVRALDEFET